MRLRTIALALAVALSSAPFVIGQDFPQNAVRLVVPFPPGGAADVLARLLSEALSERWAQPVLVDYRPGAGTIIGTDAVARAAPDGHTLGLVVTSFVINPAIRQNLPYDTLRDFRAVAQIGEAPIVLLAQPDFPATTIAGLLAEARARPGQVAYASPGAGTATHMAGELLAREAGIDLLHVPYAGLAQALPDVLAGRVPLLFDIWHSARPYIQSGRLRVLALASPGELPGHPGLPSLPAAFPGFSALSIQGIVAPAATPDAVVDGIAADIRSVILSPEFVQELGELGVRPVASTPDAFDRLLRTEIERWTQVAEVRGIRIEEE